MSRAIDLALRGIRNAAPNPMVGCVIEKEGKVIAEGYHQEFGEPHAEINALSALPPNADLSDARMYVTLEPCNHFGKTPPCTQAIINSGITSVIIGMKDPSNKVAGKGIDQLKYAGIKVKVLGQGSELLDQFLVNESGRPYVTLKWAESVDGIAGSDRKVWFSAPETRFLTHRLRAQHQWMLIGSNTVLTDDPQLSTRYYPGNSPNIMILDRDSRIKLPLRLLETEREVLIFTCNPTLHSKRIKEVKINRNEPLQQIMNFCRNNNIGNLLVEGGPGLLNHFIEKGIWNRIFKFISPDPFGEEGRAVDRNIYSSEKEVVMIGCDQLHFYKS